MRKNAPLDVIVVGAGVVGACLALALARDGRRVAIVEAGPPPVWRAEGPGLRVVALAADSVALLAGLGVWDAVVAAHAQPIRRMRVWDAGGGHELEFDADRFGQPDLGGIVEQALLADRLWHALAASPQVARHCPARVAGLGQETGSAHVELDDGGRLQAPLVVAADGGGSRLRALAGIEVDRHDYGQHGLVAYVRTADPHLETAWQRFLPGGPLALLPCRDGRCSIVWSLPDAEARRLLAIDEAAFRRELTRASDARLGAVVGVSARAAFPLRRQLARHYVAGRLVLAGDAAHTVHPLAGQGINLGLRDVACLRALASRAGGRDLGAAHRLARYQRRRRIENAGSAHAFEWINHLYSNQGLLPTLLRGPMLGLAAATPGLARLLWRHASGHAVAGGTLSGGAPAR